MKKILVGLSTLAVLTSSSTITNLIANHDYQTQINVQLTQRAVTINGGTVLDYGKDVILRTGAINLSALGIYSNRDLHQYTTIELNDFEVTFLGGSKKTDGFRWGAKMSEGEGDWALISEYTINAPSNNGGIVPYYTTIERKHSLWYDQYGTYNLALIYRFNCAYESRYQTFYGQIQAQTGSIANFY